MGKGGFSCSWGLQNSEVIIPSDRWIGSGVSAASVSCRLREVVACSFRRRTSAFGEPRFTPR